MDKNIFKSVVNSQEGKSRTLWQVKK